MSFRRSIRPAPAFLRYIDILRTAPDMKWAHIFPAGADHYLYVEMLKQGLRITSSAGANTEVVAHSAMSGLLALARQVPRSIDSQRRHAWEPLFGGKYAIAAVRRRLAHEVGLVAEQAKAVLRLPDDVKIACSRKLRERRIERHEGEKEGEDEGNAHDRWRGQWKSF